MKRQLFLVVCVLLIILTDQGEGWRRRRRRRRRPPPRVNCAVSNWSGWQRCSKTCGGGLQTRTRRITTHPRHGGHGCPVLSQRQRCNTQGCPCLVSTWGRWGSCSRACGGGWKYRSRKITKKASPGGKCLPLKDKLRCNTKKCIHCKVGRWSAWTKCTKPCDSGTKRRSRRIIKQKGAGGRSCPNLTESKTCNVQKCPCKVSDWSKWGSCNKRCGGGQQWRSRSVVRKESPGGTRCPLLRQKRSCNNGRCRHCRVSAWSRWGKCDKTCDGGTKTRTRRVQQNPGSGGRTCPNLRQTTRCNTGKCGCKVSAWSAWGRCDEPCGPGKQRRGRRVLREPSLGGRKCPTLTQTKSCQRARCHCKVSAWGAWARCSKPCGIGIQIRSRRITKKPSSGGMRCPNMREQQLCKVKDCPRHCKVSRWGGWSKCLDRGKNYCLVYGLQYRRRRIVAKAVSSGRACPLLKQTRRCKCKSCARIVCKPTHWGAWSACRRVQGCLMRFRSRTIRSGKRCKTIRQCRHC